MPSAANSCALQSCLPQLSLARNHTVDVLVDAWECRVYESAAGQDKRRVSKYCMRMLGDYIIAIASHTPEVRTNRVWCT